MTPAISPEYDTTPSRLFGSGVLTAPVNFLTFSSDGSYLAVGCADLRVFVVQVGSWTVTRMFQLAKAQPTTALWARNWPGTCLFVGDVSGDLHDIVIGQSPETDWKNVCSVGGPVYALAHEGQWLAVSAGHSVRCLEVLSYSSHHLLWNGAKSCERPSNFQGLVDAGAEPVEPVAIDLRFTPGGSLLVGTYERHGILLWDNQGQRLKHIVPHSVCIGGACISPAGDRLYVTNLANGVDIYKIEADHPESSAWVKTLNTPIGAHNSPVPIACVHAGALILVGGTEGKVQLLSTEDDDPNAFVNWSRSAPAFAQLVQTVAYTEVDGPQRCQYIAFGAFEKGKGGSVTVFRGRADPSVHGALQLVRRGEASDGVKANINRRYLNHVLPFIVRILRTGGSLLALGSLVWSSVWACFELGRLVKWLLIILLASVWPASASEAFA